MGAPSLMTTAILMIDKEYVFVVVEIESDDVKRTREEVGI